MKPSRFELLHPESASVHMFWRCHNKEHYLSKMVNKALYMNHFTESFQKKHLSYYGKVQLHAYCIMSNHFHCLMTYTESSKNLSNFVRRANGTFGYDYNKIHKRSGKVAESRFKSSLIENIEHTMRVHFYIEANPLRAGLATLKTLHKFKYSSYRYYAYGLKDEYTEYLTVPEWYIKLGSTPIERQKKYRRLFYEYLKEESQTQSLAPVILSYFIGSVSWRQTQRDRCLASMKDKQNKSRINTS